MKIGVDASRHNVKSGTGVELYSVKIIQGLIEHFKHNPEHELILYTPRKLMLFKARNIKHRLIPFKRLWTKVRLSLEMLFHKPDVLFVPSHVLPYFSPKRCIITVHDVAFMHMREAYSRFQFWYLKRETKRAVKKASTIIVPSEATAKDLRHFFKCPDEKIKVIHHGHEFKPINFPAEFERELFERLGIKRSDHFFLFIGRLEEKKNIYRLMKAFNKFKENFANYKLILAGSRGHGFAKLLKKSLKSDIFSGVLMPGYITDREKHVLLKYCDAFVFPTLYEGFGFPVLEAYSYGKPVLTSNTASLPEVAGEGAVYVDPLKIESIEEGLVKLVKNPDLKKEKYDIQKAQINKFKWDGAIEKTIKLLIS